MGSKRMVDPSVIRLPNLDEAALASLAQQLGAAITQGGLIYLIGDLGAGKTTFARALIKALGVADRIKSPTYSLIESYRSALLSIHHLDLYRIADPGELEWLGLPDLLTPDALLLVARARWQRAAVSGFADTIEPRRIAARSCRGRMYCNGEILDARRRISIIARWIFGPRPILFQCRLFGHLKYVPVPSMRKLA
jgi:tRNA threonylcarbamoyl adenosine modification protein YjeE